LGHDKILGRTMSRNGSHNANILHEEIRRQFGSVGTTRFVHSLPAFQVESDLPDRFSSLLTELELAEADRRHAGLGHAGLDRRRGRDA
jgi:hypothetical protein